MEFIDIDQNMEMIRRTEKKKRPSNNIEEASAERSADDLEKGESVDGGVMLAEQLFGGSVGHQRRKTEQPREAREANTVQARNRARRTTKQKSAQEEYPTELQSLESAKSRDDKEFVPHFNGV